MENFKILLLMMLVFFTEQLYAQSKSEINPPPPTENSKILVYKPKSDSLADNYKTLEVPAEYPGGKAEWQKYLQKV